MSKLFYTTKEASNLLGVTQRTIQLWSDSGMLDVKRTPGGHRRISAVSFENLLKKMKFNTVEEESFGDKKKYKDVLLVDDDEDFLKMMMVTLSKWNLPINILTAKDGYEGLIAVGHQKPSILITDLNMRGIDGRYMIKKIQENSLTQDIDICVVTGQDLSEQERLIVIGDIPCFRKPLDLKIIKKYIEEKIV